MRSEKFFSDNNIKNTRETSWLDKLNSLFILSVIISCYYFGSYSDLPTPICASISFLAGIFVFLALTHICHDISHNSYSFRSPLLWKTAGHLAEILVGQSMYLWIHRHVFAHHIYTNLAGVDPDIGVYKCTPKKSTLQYRAKPICVPFYVHCFIYVLSTFQMQLDDFYSFFRGSMENSKINDVGVKRTLIFLGFKFLYYFHRIMLPIYLGQGVIFSISMFLITEAASGLFFGYFSQISHVSDEREWPIQPTQDWAELQILTSCDYAQDSFFWTYLSGYLNYQVTHHLFPSIASQHLPQLLPIVVETCKEYKVPYTEYSSFWECCKHHFNHVKKFEIEVTSESSSILTFLGWIENK